MLAFKEGFFVMARKFLKGVLIFISVTLFANMSLAEQNDLGGLTPEAALEYMQKNAGNLILIDVAPTRWFERETFNGAIHIPENELDGAEKDKRYSELPNDKPILLFCRRGVTVLKAYPHVKDLRPDIPEISYIAGAPLFKDYNEWLIAKDENSGSENNFASTGNLASSADTDEDK